jgi:CelD/BcsL family acetyltransferase involved in cellulose biosynthesis
MVRSPQRERGARPNAAVPATAAAGHCDDPRVSGAGDGGLPVREHAGRAALRALEPALGELHERTATPVTARVRWLEAWVAAYPRWEPWVLTVADGAGELTAAAAFARRSIGPVIRVVGLGHGTSDDARFPALDGAAAKALAAGVADAFTALGRPWSLLVEQLPVDCPVTDALLARLPHARELPGQGMPMAVVGERDLGRFLSRNARQAENKARNRLVREQRTLTERWVSSPEEVRAAIPRLSAVHRARDAQLGRVSDHEDPARAAFYADVLARHAEAGEVDLLLLEVDGDLAGYVAAFRDGRALRVWDNRVSPSWAEFSAGRLANHEAIRRVVLGTDYDMLDWMRGEEPYKLSSATVVVPTRYLEAWSSPAARLPYAAKAVLRRWRDRSPGLDRTVGRLRAGRGRMTD